MLPFKYSKTVALSISHGSHLSLNTTQDTAVFEENIDMCKMTSSLSFEVTKLFYLIFYANSVPKLCYFFS